MGNSKIAKYSRDGKQNIPQLKPTEKTNLRGNLSICVKQVKNGKKMYFMVFTCVQPSSSKFIKWRKGQPQISDVKDQNCADLDKAQQVGQFSEIEIIDAIKWSSTGAFASSKSSSSDEWCKSVCWKLGKKINLK